MSIAAWMRWFASHEAESQAILDGVESSPEFQTLPAIAELDAWAGVSEIRCLARARCRHQPKHFSSSMTTRTADSCWSKPWCGNFRTLLSASVIKAPTPWIIAQEKSLSAIIVHRTADVEGIQRIEELRAANPSPVIVMVSGVDRSELAVRAGATCFLNYGEWLRLGSLVMDLLRRSPATTGPGRTP